jgi:hypothetical protein
MQHEELPVKSDRIMHLFQDPGPFASAYVDLSQDREDADELVALKIRSACDRLRQDGAPEAVVDSVRAALEVVPEGPAPLSRCVVATERGVLLDEVTRTRREQPTAAWSALPDVSDWLADESQSVPFVLAVVDHEGGGVTVHRSGVYGRTEQSEAGGETEFEHKVRGGGWAHLKWQHYVESVWARNAKAVAEEINRHVRNGIGLVLVAGDPQTRPRVVEALDDSPGVTVMEIDAGGRSADGSDAILQQAVARALDEAVTTSRLAEIDELQERLGRDDSVSIGVDDTVDAFVLGQVDRLLIDPGRAADFAVEPARHPGLALGAIEPPGALPADAVLVAAATLTGADIDIAPASMLSGAPAAGLLRWDQPAEGARA